MANQSVDAPSLDASYIGTKLVNQISLKGGKAFERQYAAFKELLESIEPEAWPTFHERHLLLRIAASRGREEPIKLLLERWREPNVGDRDPKTGRTALHEAAFNGHVSITKLLLESGAAPDLLSLDLGEAPLHRALYRPRFRKTSPPMSQEGTVQVLLEHGANPNIQDYQGQTPVHYAARNSHTKSLSLLLDNPNNHGSRNRFDKDGNTPLHIAALMGHVDEVRILLGDSAVHLNTGNQRKETPLYFAATQAHTVTVTEWSKHNETVQLLLDKGADTTHQKIHGLTMLDWAANDDGKASAANLILRKEYKTWPASWFQEPGPTRALHLLSLPLETESNEARRAFKASAMWFFQRYCKASAIDENLVDHSKCYWSSVDDMVYNSTYFGEVYEQLNPERKEGFAWFNLPENNLQWVLDLQHRISCDQRSIENDAAQIDPQAFMEWFHASQPYQLAPQFRQNVYYGEKKSVQNVFISIPYLSVESHKRRMDYENVVHGPLPSSKGGPSSRDEESLDRYKYLVSIYGGEYENQLIRKTLDKYHYHNLRQTSRRDASQVILRASQVDRSTFQLDEKTLLESDKIDELRSQWWPRGDTPLEETEPGLTQNFDGDVLMVDQACLWILGDDTIITSFPSSWKTKDISTDPLTRILECLEGSNRPPITSASELAAFIILQCSTMYTASWRSRFNSIINMTADLQVGHFKSFVRSSHITDNAQDYRKPQAKRDLLKKAEEELTSIRREVKNLCEVSDIVDELHIIERVLHEQAGVINQIVATDSNNQRTATWQSSRLRLQHQHLKAEISNSHAEVKKMLENAERTHAAILQLLELKQQQATVTESRTARKQSEDTARQNDTVQLFTFVTIIFTPASFMAAFFAIPNLSLPGIDTSNLNGAVGTIVVFSTVIWLPIIAYIFGVDGVRNWFERRGAQRRQSAGPFRVASWGTAGRPEPVDGGAGEKEAEV